MEVMRHKTVVEDLGGGGGGGGGGGTKCERSSQQGGVEGML